jgi:outer membrane protein OmpA-like peptidoglycan-associated protein
MTTGNSLSIAQYKDGLDLRFRLCLSCPNSTSKTRIDYPVVSALDTHGSSAKLPDSQSAISVYFPLGSSVLSIQEKQRLLQYFSLLPSSQHSSLQIEGFTDHSGSQSYNDWLALMRGQSVYRFINHLFPQYIDVTVNGRGKCCYISGHQTDQERAKNRRTTVTFISNTAPEEGQIP